ncbi:MAG: hypothetical protein BWK78_04150 [Thiotrichaceae bacterium IS1]|nr:MAG: hypothetical protein BWK78_04150 [Thiotrichaceae bacterium IS1]
MLLFLVFQLGGCSHFGDGEKTTPGEGEKTVVKSETGTSDTSKLDSNNGAQGDSPLPAATPEPGSKERDGDAKPEGDALNTDGNSNSALPEDKDTKPEGNALNTDGNSNSALPEDKDTKLEGDALNTDGNSNSVPPEDKDTKPEDSTFKTDGSNDSPPAGETPPVSLPATTKPPTGPGSNVTAKSPTLVAECPIFVKEGEGNYSPLLKKENVSYTFKSCQPGQPDSCKTKVEWETKQEVQQKLVVLMSKQDVQTLQSQTKELAEAITGSSGLVDQKVQSLQKTLNTALEKAKAKNFLPEPTTPTLRENMVGLIIEANSAEKEVLVKYLKKREILLGVVLGEPVELGDWDSSKKEWLKNTSSATKSYTKSYSPSSELKKECPQAAGPEQLLVPLTYLP